MIVVLPNQEFTIGYPVSSLLDSLFIGATVYDVSTGTPVFSQFIELSNVDTGLYLGSYTAGSNKQYLVKCLAYTDNTYSTVKSNVAPWVECYKTADSAAGLILFNYGAFDQNNSLFIQASITNIVSLISVMIPLVFVSTGVYFGLYSGGSGQSYSVYMKCFTDDTYETINFFRPPAFDVVSTIPSNANVFVQGKNLVLVAQNFIANLASQNYNATLEVT